MAWLVAQQHRVRPPRGNCPPAPQNPNAIIPLSRIDPRRRIPCGACTTARWRGGAGRAPHGGDGRRRPVPAHPVVDPRAHEPAEQQVEVKLLHQLALRSDRIAEAPAAASLARSQDDPCARTEPPRPPTSPKVSRSSAPGSPEADGPVAPSPLSRYSSRHSRCSRLCSAWPSRPDSTPSHRITPIPSAPVVFQQPARKEPRLPHCAR